MVNVGLKSRFTSAGVLYRENADPNRVIERLAGGPIPSAVVRTEAGRARQVRTIDLAPIAKES